MHKGQKGAIGKCKGQAKGEKGKGKGYQRLAAHTKESKETPYMAVETHNVDKA